MKRMLFNINGVDRSLVVDPENTLADVLSDQLMLTGCKVCCSEGQCGTCTVIVDGNQARLHDRDEEDAGTGAKITTIEGIGAPGQSASAAGGLDGARRRAVRHLHARLHHVGQSAARKEQQSNPRGSSHLVRKQPQPLPLHRLQAPDRRGDGRGHDDARRTETGRPASIQPGEERKTILGTNYHRPSAARQGHRHLGLRRRRGAAHAARHAASGLRRPRCRTPTSRASTPPKPRRCRA